MMEYFVIEQKSKIIQKAEMMYMSKSTTLKGKIMPLSVLINEMAG